MRDRGFACTCRVVIFSGDVIFKPVLVSMKVVKISLPKYKLSISSRI